MQTEVETAAQSGVPETRCESHVQLFGAAETLRNSTLERPGFPLILEPYKPLKKTINPKIELHRNLINPKTELHRNLLNPKKELHRNLINPKKEPLISVVRGASSFLCTTGFLATDPWVRESYPKGPKYLYSRM